MLQALETMRCMPEALEGGLCLAEVLKVLDVLDVLDVLELLTMLEVPEVTRRVRLCMLEVVEGRLVCWGGWRRCTVCWRLWRVGSFCLAVTPSYF